MSVLDGLNERQKEAVLCKDQHLRIIAGAGSGKTRVVTTRIAYLIDECHVWPNQILAITFTNKAAREMILPKGFRFLRFTLFAFACCGRIFMNWDIRVTLPLWIVMIKKAS